MKPGDLVQIKKGVQGRGEVGVVIGEVEDHQWNSSFTLLVVLFHDGLRRMHPYNLQEPDGQGSEKA